MSITESTRISNELFDRLDNYTMDMAQNALCQWILENEETMEDRHIFTYEIFMAFKELVTDSINEGITEICFRHYHLTCGADESFDGIIRDVIQALWEVYDTGPIIGY